MNMYEAAKFKSWLDKYEAAQELSEKTGTKFSHADVLRFALDRGLRLVVYVPTGMRGKHGWNLSMGSGTC